MSLDITTMANYPRFAAAIAALSTAQTGATSAQSTAVSASDAFQAANAAFQSSVGVLNAANGEVGVSANILQQELIAALQARLPGAGAQAQQHAAIVVGALIAAGISAPAGQASSPVAGT